MPSASIGNLEENRSESESIMANYPDLAAKVVLVTGGANGIGRAMVKRFVEQKSRVYFCDIDAESGAKLATELGELASFSRVDLTVESEVRDWIEQIAADSHRIDVLLNNAARDPRIPLPQLTMQEWDSIFSLNLRAAVIAIQQAAPTMSSGSSVINFSSITHHLSPAAMSAYVATKSAIIGLTRSLARELGASKIRVNTLSPGWTMTERQMAEHVTDAIKDRLAKEQCIGDLLQPEEIADVALFLASDASRAITGQEILADHGWAHS